MLPLYIWLFSDVGRIYNCFTLLVNWPFYVMYFVMYFVLSEFLLKTDFV